MLLKKKTILNVCFSTIFQWRGVKPLLYSLALSTALVTPAFADTSAPEINTEYLNSLTGPKVTWEAADATGDDIIEINGNYYKYTYRMPDGYTEKNTRLEYSLYPSETDTQSVVFKDIQNSSHGGAIYNNLDYSNKQKIITADFVNNNTNAENYVSGGAIYSDKYRKIDTIIGSFINNYAQSTTSLSSGGAISNNQYTSLGNITGNFINNFAQASFSASGGAIYNENNGTIGNITGSFINNFVSGNYGADGGAINNRYKSSVGDITGDFISNYALAQDQKAFGGAIYNQGTIGDINGNLTDNHALTAGHSSYNKASGGAIYNLRGTINNISSNFTNNSVQSYDEATGGAVFNYTDSYTQSYINSIIGNFIGNYALSETSNAIGGTIYNDGERAYIGDITGDFISNYALAQDQKAFGGAIYNSGIINNIAGGFSNNHAESPDSSTLGGAIFNDGAIVNITGNFIDNYVVGVGRSEGGAINNNGAIGNIVGDFIGNYAESPDSHPSGGAIFNNGAIGNITGNFIGNHAESPDSATIGGAIYNAGTMSLTNSSFYDHYAFIGGAIFNDEGVLNITADNGESIFSGNMADMGIGEFIPNAIFSIGGKIYLNVKNNGFIQFDDTLFGESTTINIYGERTYDFGNITRGIPESDVLEQIELLESYGVTVNKSADGNTYSYYEGGIAEASEELDLPGEGYYYVFSNTILT